LIDSAWNANGDFAAFDVRASGSLAAWFSSATLMLCGVLSLYVYSVRRCRLDDYRGRYRVWLWSAIAWAAMSIDTVAGLRHAIRAGMVQATGRAITGDGRIWWLGPAVLILGVLLVRLLIDVRASRLALTSLMLGGMAWTAALVLSLVEVPLDERIVTLLLSGMQLGGTWLLLVGILANARYVVLDANGELPVAEPKAKREKKPKAEKTSTASSNEADEQGDVSTVDKSTVIAKSTKVAKIDAAHSQPLRPAGQSSAAGQTASSPTTARSSSGVGSSSGSGLSGSSSTATASKPLFSVNHSDDSSDDDDDDQDDQSSDGDRKLSRAERKKLRKQQRG